jgi:ABC-type dipeptide/oligopeptide/nickel transport system permease subunit
MNMFRRLIRLILHPKSDLKNLSSGVESASLLGDSDPKDSRQRRMLLRQTLTNLPLMLGITIVAGLFLMVIFGPVWAPKNPYIAGQQIAPHYDFEQEIFIRPPLPPSAEFPLGTDRWGTDLLSMLLHSTRNTLVACAFITMVRILFGLGLGAFAGWNAGSTADQIIMGLIGVVTSVPMLISSMLLIYALDIRRGLPVFIVALAAIGWTEIAQYIRSEFLVLKKKPFIEGARSLGLTGFAISIRHVLPNILPQLLVISFLEMGAVMMLLGELGFIGVYIGGGSRISIEVEEFVREIYHLPEVPEWGAMLAEGFRYLRSKPFVVIPPALAFFVSVVGFNTLGEGLRRQIEISRLNTAFLLRKRMILVITILTASTVYIINQTGPAPWFAKVAQAFNGDLAYEHVKELTALDGRGIGQVGGEEAANYISERFEAYGLEPAWSRDSYIYPIETQLVEPIEQPELQIVSLQNPQSPPFKHQIDFGYVIEGHGGSGDVEAEVTFIGFLRQPASLDAYRGLDLRGRIAMVIEGNAPNDFATEALIRGAQGVIWVTGDGETDVRSQKILRDSAANFLRKPQIPIFKVRPSVAEGIVQADGITLSTLLTSGSEIVRDGKDWFMRELSTSLRMDLSLTEPTPIEISNIVGFKRGADFEYADELVIIFASYDGLGIDPDGTIFPASNHDATGVGILLEVARLWQEQELETRRTVLFVAWGGGTFDQLGAIDYLGARYNFRYIYTSIPSQRVAPSAIFYLDFAGTGSETIQIHPSSSRQLTELIIDTADEVGVPVDRGPQEPDMNRRAFPMGISWIGLSWGGSGVRPDEDVLDRIQPEKLQQLGEVFALAITRVVRQAIY